MNDHSASVYEKALESSPKPPYKASEIEVMLRPPRGSYAARVQQRLTSLVGYTAASPGSLKREADDVLCIFFEAHSSS
jgi:hypothetical protein